MSNGGAWIIIDEYLSVAILSTLTTHATWCRGSKPHTGPKAFVAMRQREGGETEHHHAPSRKARQPGRHESNQIPRGRDQRKNWTRTPLGTAAGGKEVSTNGGGEPTTTKRPKEKRGAQPTTKRSTTPTEKAPKTAQADTPTQSSQLPKWGHERESKTQDQGHRAAGKAQPRSRPHPITPPDQMLKQKRGGHEGTQPHRSTQKDPHHTAASGNNPQCGAQGERAQ